MRNLELESDSKDTVIAEKNAEIAYRVNKEGKIIADKVAAEMRAKDLAAAYPELANQIRKEMGIELKNLKVAIVNEIQAKGSGVSTITNNHYIDSTGKEQDSTNLDVSDGHLSFHATIFDNNYAPYDYSYTDSITTAMYMKKKWFMGNEKLYSSSMLSNKNAKVTSSTNILMKDYRDKRFGIGPYIGYSIRGQVDVGIGLHYDLFKF